MGLFWGKEQYQGCNIYSMKKYVDRKRIIFNIIVGAVTIITLMLVIYYIVDTSVRIKRSKQFELQIIEAQKQQEEVKKQKEIERQAKIPKLTDVGKENLKKIYNRETKRAFLTFDDGPSKNTNDILNILRDNNIKATFFVLGSQVEVFPETTNRIYNEGHFIANHGYSHRYSDIYQSPEQVLNEYNQCNDAIKKAIGENEYNSHLFRFPGGLAGGKYASIKSQANELLEQNNIAHVDWNALNGDAETNNLSPEFEISRIHETTEGKNSIVVLMHDSPAKSVTADTLPQIIATLRDKGYEFKNFYEIIK